MSYSIEVEEHPLRIRNRHWKGDNATKPFIAWDGEGYTDADGVHHYNLFGCSTGEYVHGKSLDYRQCFELLLDVGSREHANHVIFAGGYDVVMMIRKLPQKVCDRIMHSHPTWWEGYRIEYFKGKYLKLSHADTHRSIILYDVFTFFSTSFVRACREYLGDSEDFDRIEQVKLQRDSFQQQDLEELVIPYWQQELKYLVNLCTILRKRLIDANIKPSQWHGPGAVASAVLKAKGMRAHMATTPEPVREAARHAYYGGRFEQFKAGYYEGQVHQYDIRSAYPKAISLLPSLANLEWQNKRRNRNRWESFGLYQISIDLDPTLNIYHKPGPLPWRRFDKAIYFPHDLAPSWYWGIEIESVARNYPHLEITVHEAWEPKNYFNSFPFAWVETMYEDRAKMKREGNPTQLALKLAMNSLYGKLAQSKGARKRNNEWQLPRYHQIEWAGWVTAFTRARMLDAIAQAGDDLIAVETDAVYTTRELPNLPESERLGDWEHDISEAILYMQSGVYFKRAEVDKWKLKTRGFEPRGHRFDRWIEIMRRLPNDPTAVATQVVRRFGTDPNSARFATWYDMERTTDLMSQEGKRIHVKEFCKACADGMSYADGLHTLIVPQHLINSGSVPSTPHALPWIEGMSEWVDDWEVTEDGFTILDFQ